MLKVVVNSAMGGGAQSCCYFPHVRRRMDALAVLPPVGGGCSAIFITDSFFFHNISTFGAHFFWSFPCKSFQRPLISSPEVQSLARQIPSVLVSSRASSTAKGYFSFFRNASTSRWIRPNVALYLLNLVQSGFLFSRITSAFYAAIVLFHNSVGVESLRFEVLETLSRRSHKAIGWLRSTVDGSQIKPNICIVTRTLTIS